MNKFMADENNEGQNPTPVAAKPEEDMTADELAALHADEDFIANFKDEDKDDPAKVTLLNEAILRSAQTTIHQKRHYREQVKAGKPAAPANPAPKPTAQEKVDEKKVDPQVATDFRLDHPELTKEQQLKVIAHAGAYSITPEEALKDPLIQQFISNTRTQEDVEDASPSPARKSGQGIADRDWSNASPAEMEAARNKMLYD